MSEKQIFVVDQTGKNKICFRCKVKGGHSIQSWNEKWACEGCISILSALKEEKVANQAKMKRRLKKARRTLKGYILERLQESQEPISTLHLAEEALKECLTKQTDVKKVKGSVSVTISLLRKEMVPIDKVKKGVYQWRHR